MAAPAPGPPGYIIEYGELPVPHAVRQKNPRRKVSIKLYDRQ